VAVDDASRLAYVEVLPDQKGVTAVAFLERALRFFKRHHRERFVPRRQKVPTGA